VSSQNTEQQKEEDSVKPEIQEIFSTGPSKAGVINKKIRKILGMGDEAKDESEYSFKVSYADEQYFILMGPVFVLQVARLRKSA